jgi:hypothetical protein
MTKNCCQELATVFLPFRHGLGSGSNILIFNIENLFYVIGEYNETLMGSGIQGFFRESIKKNKE